MPRPTVPLVVLFVALAGCATREPGPRFELFGELPVSDVFTPGVRVWQAAAASERASQRALPEDASLLAEAYVAFERALRRQVAADVLRFVQTSSGLYFQPDGEFDYWPTFGEVMERGGDDCDGMDVLTFELLRRSGFEPGEIYRVILFNAELDLHHMATLWLEDGREDDPWLLDPTGQISRRMRRLSELSASWTPLAVFDETERYRALPAGSDVADSAP